MYQEWGHVDRSHRKLAHRGSWLGRFWCDPSTAKRILDAGGLRFRAQPKRTRTEKRPWPHWVEPAPNRVWIYDTERHEAFLNPAVVRGHRVGLVAASWLKLRAAGPGGHRGGWKQP